jgi:hypothetical protein
MPATQAAKSSQKLFLQICSSALFCVPLLNAMAQQPLRTLLVGVDHRQTVSLNGAWHFLVEQPPARELYDDQGNVRDSGYAQNTRPNISSGPHNSEYDFAAAPTLKGPEIGTPRIRPCFASRESSGTSGIFSLSQSRAAARFSMWERRTIGRSSG